MADNILKVHIRKRIGDFSLQADFEAGDGVLSLLGASGCGKSLTLKCIAGIEKPDEGQILLGSRILFDSSEKINLTPQKRHVGYMFQDYALFPNMTVRQNVLSGMGKRPGAKEADPYLERFCIAEYADRLPAGLSGGQKQRAAMARLAAQNPDVILLDEPFSALDSYLKWQLEDEMHGLLSEVNKPAVFVSHDRDEVYHMSSQICCMRDGQTETQMERDRFFRFPQTKTAAILSGCKNVSEVFIEGGRVRVPAWNLEYTGSFPAGPKPNYLGIRAHSFSREITEKDDLCIPVFDAHIVEDPFEWTIFFKTSADGRTLQWKTPKQSEGGFISIPERLYLKRDSLLYLF